VVDAGVTAEELMAVFGRLRGHWRGIFESLPESANERESVAQQVRKGLVAVTTAARVSEEAAAFVETAFRARLGELGVDPAGLPEAVSEVAHSLRNAFENLIRSLQQMESGDDILPETGREMRRSAARAVAFFHELRKLDADEQDTTAPPGQGRGDDDKTPGGEARPPGSRDAVLRRLTQSYDGRRKMIRDDTEVPPPAVEAVEFLLRLGAG
jgi:hypothetical protein